MATGGGTVNEGFQEEQQEQEEGTSLKEPVNDEAGPRWDCFEVRDEGEVVISTSSTYGGWRVVHQVAKVLFIVVVAVVVLTSAVIAKVSVLLLTTLGGREPLYSVLAGPARRPVLVPWAWSLFACVVAPHVIALLVSLWRLLMRSADHVTSQTGNIPPVDLALLMVTEGLQSLGVSVLFFAVLPEFDPPVGAILVLNTAVIPSLVSLATRGPPSQTPRVLFIGRVVAAVIGCLLQLGSAGAFLYKLQLVLPTRTLACLAASLVLVSLAHWENYSGGVPALEAMRQRMMERRKRRVMHIVVSLWKVVVSLVAFIVLFGARADTSCVRVLFGRSPGPEGPCPIWQETYLYNWSFPEFLSCQPGLPFILAALNVLLGVTCYTAGKAACKIGVSRLSMALPLVLAPPLSFGLLLLLRSPGRQDWLHACTPLWGEVSEMSVYLEGYVKGFWLPMGVASYLSIILIAFHVWRPLTRKQLKSQHLFFKPIYCDVLPDQSLLLNRTKWPEQPVLNQESSQSEGYSRMSMGGAPEGAVPLVYVCATMWHEQRQEMRQMMHSIFRLDADCWARKHLAKKDTDGIDYDVYDLQSHIFVDDAFDVPKSKTEKDDVSEGATVNNYVRLLVEIVEATAKDKEFKTEVRPPMKTATPYGGRLVWTLPGGTTLTAHLKDKAKIRHRKRWSQVMYMYYFLGHELMEADMADEVRRAKADHTFLLALDGDVDFQPQALRLLVDRLKAEPNVGAACGRIHPIGQGPMVWYQKFEYAVSHWLQKSTEHVTGCVLCSPGCFSLFRGSALMAENVMARYTTPPTEARHYVQYDQGEDRWLCTLLLQQGYRVEYCAASDSFTFAPEGFYEFFNQRRRWTPSTMANILDLLQDWRHVRRSNPDISLAYILYQVLLLSSSVLTPGTIFLLVVGALSTAFPGLGLLGALLLNAIPVALFVLLCFLAKPSVQLDYAAVLSGLYSLLMMVVLVGLIRQAVMHGLCSVSTIFLLAIVAIFLVSALIHPQEFTCVLHGFLYFLSVPSTSMLLMIYSLGNLHVVSWGTRENAPPPSASPQEGGKSRPPKTGLQRLLAFLLGDSGTRDSKAQTVPEKQEKMEEGWGGEDDPPPVRPHPLTRSLNSLPRPRNPAYTPGSDEEGEEGEEGEVPYERPSWLNDANLGRGKEDVLPAKERNFWIQLIDKYLKPLDKDEKKQGLVQQELLALRNKVCLFFYLVNGLFIVLIVTWQALAESTPGLSITIPCRRADFRPETLAPISLAFMAVFGVLLAVQFLAMLAHRGGTLLHVLAATPLPCSQEPSVKAEREEMVLEMKRIQQGSVREADYEEPAVVSQDKAEEVDRRKQKRDLEWRRRSRRLQDSQRPPVRPPKPLTYMQKVQQYCDLYANESEIREALERSRGQPGGRAGKDLSKTVQRRATIVQRTRGEAGGAQGGEGGNPPPVGRRPPRGPAKKRVEARRSRRAPPPPPSEFGYPSGATPHSEDGDIYETLEMKEAEEEQQEEEEENYQNVMSSR